MEQDSFNTFQYLIDFTQAEWFKFSLEELNTRPHPAKWSRKEILGHLIDSCINNTRRLIIGQFEPLKIEPYNQDKWVEVQNYLLYNEDEIIKTWYTLNGHLLNVVKNIREQDWERECILEENKVVTLRWLFYDYIAHMKHHLKQIFGNHPDL